MSVQANEYKKFNMYTGICKSFNHGNISCNTKNVLIKTIKYL